MANALILVDIFEINGQALLHISPGVSGPLVGGDSLTLLIRNETNLSPTEGESHISCPVDFLTPENPVSTSPQNSGEIRYNWYGDAPGPGSPVNVPLGKVKPLSHGCSFSYSIHLFNSNTQGPSELVLAADPQITINPTP